jgi:hypothetical protein
MTILSYKIEIVDNFLSKHDFNELNSLKLKKKPNVKVSVFNNIINKKNEIENSCLDKNLIFNLHKNYHKKMISILKKLNPKKVDLYDYSNFTIIISDKHAKFPVHDDTPNKLLSGVIYLKPKKNYGTIFFEKKNGKKSEVVDWKQNRGVFFSRIERKTWHSFRGDSVSDRVTLVYNLNTTKIADVFKIEKKNYFIGNLRYKINPYLNKYLRLTI